MMVTVIVEGGYRMILISLSLIFFKVSKFSALSAHYPFN